MVTRQDAAMATSTAAIPKEHAEKMVQMALGQYVTPSKKEIKTKFSPQAISRRHEFLSETEEPLYSVEQVQTLLRDLVGENKPAADKQPATATVTSPSDKGKALRMPEATDSPSTKTISADTMLMSTASTRHKLEVVCEATGSPLTIILRLQTTATIEDVNQELASSWNIATPHAFKLHFERADGVKVTLTHIDDVWDLLPTARGRWVFQSITPLTPQQARLDHELPSAISDNVSRRLSYDSLEAEATARLTQALRLQQLEQSVTAEIKAAVATAVKPYGDTIGKAGRSPAETFYNALRVTEDLTIVLARLSQKARRRCDPTEEQQRLQWFIEAILDRLADDVKKRWLGQEDPARRDASFYSSWTQFKACLFTIMRNVIDFTPDGLMDQLPNLVVTATCASRNDLWVAIEQVQQAAKILAAMKSIEATAQIEAATVKYLEAFLTPTAMKSIVEALASKHRAEASDFYALKQHPPLTAYPSRCIKAVMLGRDDFDGDWRHEWRAPPTKDTPPSSGKGAGGGAPRGENQRISGARSETPRIRVLKRNQQTQEFSYYLKDVPDAGERARQEKLFLANTLLDWKCHKCGGQGHTQEICPKFFNLDGRLFERNPKSFFFDMRPPVQVLDLRNAATVKVMPVLEVTPAPAFQPAVTRAGHGGPVPLSSTELDPQELQEFLAWRAGTQSGN